MNASSYTRSSWRETTAYSRAKLSESVRTMLPGLRSVSRGGDCGSGTRS
jgi:hypothetical protein